MSTNTQGGYRIGTVKGRRVSEDRAMSDLIAAEVAALLADSDFRYWTEAHASGQRALRVIQRLVAPRAATEPLPADYDPTGVGEEFTQDGPRSLYAAPAEMDIATRELRSLHDWAHPKVWWDLCEVCSIIRGGFAPRAATEPPPDVTQEAIDFIDRVQEYARLTLRRDGTPGPLEVEANIVGARLRAALTPTSAPEPGS